MTDEHHGYVDDPIGLALIDLYDVAETVTVTARLGRERWSVTVTVGSAGKLVSGRGRSVGSFDPLVAFSQAIAAAKAQLA
jgi:hypothetical protein